MSYLHELHRGICDFGVKCFEQCIIEDSRPRLVGLHCWVGLSTEVAPKPHKAGSRASAD